MLQPDGSVLIPAALAQEVLRRLSRSLLAEARSAGVPASPTAVLLLTALEAATHVSGAVVALNATADGGSSTLDWVTVLQAAELLGCSNFWVRRLIHSGQLPAQKRGRAWRIATADLDHYRFNRRAA